MSYNYPYRRRQFKRKRTGFTQAGRRRMFRRTRVPIRRRRTRPRNIRTGGFLGIETKFFDNACVNFTIPSPTDASGGEAQPTITVSQCLSSPAQGDGEQNRDGRRITAKSMFINGVVTIATQADQTNADIMPTVYIAVVLDTQTNAATIVSENVFQNTGANAILAACPVRNMSNTRRYQILKKKVIKDRKSVV